MEFQKSELDEILNIFQQESAEIIASMDEKLLKLEQEGDTKDIAMQLFRDAHSLKGSARMLGFEEIQNIAHKIEDIISLIKEDKLKITTKITDTISECLDFISTLINKTVEQKTEFKSPDYQTYIEKLEKISQEEEKINYLNLKSEITQAQKEILSKFNKIEEIAIEILYIISITRKEKNYNEIYKVEKILNEFNSLCANITDEHFETVKNQTHNILASIDKFRTSDNKAFSFLEVNNTITSFIEALCTYCDSEKIQRKNYYEIVENKLNSKSQETTLRTIIFK